jgi:ubiquinone/menaquinone biosynthesis C-methylase UbiE
VKLDDGLVDQLSKLTRAQQCFVLGLIGASLLRDWQAGGDAQAARLTDLFAAIQAVHRPSADGTLPSEVPVREGYAEWAPTYDGPNPMIDKEESVVHSLLAPLLRPDVVVLDAACGTGRHLSWLAGVGHHAIGVDISKSMLQRASTAAPDGWLIEGDLRALPLAQGSVDLAICSLVLCHLPEIESALRELARVLRPGGVLVVSDPHGRAAYAGGQGFFGVGGVTRPRFVRNHYRQAHEWFDAFQTAGFTVESCQEPRMSSSDAAQHPVAEYFPAAAVAALRDVPYLWIWSVTRRAE